MGNFVVSIPQSFRRGQKESSAKDRMAPAGMAGIAGPVVNTSSRRGDK